VFNETFAQADADDSARIATEFVTRYPNVPFSWYITPENFLNHLAIGCQSSDLWNNTYVNGTTLSKALGQYLNTWTQALNKVKLSKHFLWSPSCPEINKHPTALIDCFIICPICYCSNLTHWLTYQYLNGGVL
jgi:hypothetical protein